jgi:hypothetical protein
MGASPAELGGLPFVLVYNSAMRPVKIIFNGVEYVAETRVLGMIVRGFGHTETHACRDMLRACRQFPGALPPELLGSINLD